MKIELGIALYRILINYDNIPYHTNCKNISIKISNLNVICFEEIISN